MLHIATNVRKRRVSGHRLRVHDLIRPHFKRLANTASNMSSGRPAGILVAARAVIAIDQDTPIGHAVLGEMRKPSFGQLAAQHLHRRLMRDLPQRNEDPRVGQGIDLVFKETPAGPDFLWHRLVLRRARI